MGLYTWFYDHPVLGLIILAAIFGFIIYEIYKRRKQGKWGKDIK